MRDLSNPYADLRKLQSQQRRQQSATPLRNATVSGGQTNFIGEETLRVEGSQVVVGLVWIQGPSGELRMAGTLNGNGTMNWTGPANIQGTTAITGALTVSNTFVVTSALVSMSSAAVFVASLTATGAIVGGSLQSNNNALIAGTLTNTGAPTTSSPANLFITAGGVHQRVTSAARYKIDPQELDLPDSLLDVPVEWWIDLGEAERLADMLDSPRPWTADQQRTYDDVSLRRVPGFIAEKVEASGGEAFVNYTPDGEVDGVMYDRFVGARTAVLARRAEADRARIDALEVQVARLVELLDKQP